MYQKRRTPYGVFFVVLIIMEVFAYLLSGICNVPNLSLYNWESSLRYAFMHPLTAWNDKSPLFLGVAFLIWMFLVQYYLFYYRNFGENIHGNAEWLDAEEASKELKDKDPKKNRILTQNLQVSMEGALPNNNMLVIASSGDGKTTTLVEQNFLQFASCYVMTDVKGDTVSKLGNAFLKAGYTIKCLNLKNPEKSDRYNPFVYIEREDDLIRVVNAIHDACRPPENSAAASDPFWPEAVKLYCYSLFSAAWLSAREEGKIATMNDVLRFSNQNMNRYTTEEGEERTSYQDYIDELKEKYGATYPPVRDYYKLKGGAPETVGGVIMMFNSMLAICETAEVKRIFSGNDINIRELGTGVGGDPNKKIFLPLVLPDINFAYNWIVSLFYTQMFDILARLSDDELHRPLPVRVEVWLDEFYAGAKPANPEVLLGTIRSRNICMILILQSHSQVKALYKDDKADIIMDNTSVVVFLGSGPTALSTHKWISELIAETTVDVQSDSAQFGQNRHSGVNFSQAGQKLMTPDDVKKLPSTDAIVFLKSRNPVYDTKAFPFDREELGYKAPKWLKKRYDAAVALGPYEHPVYTIYDPVHFHYITVERKEPLKVYTDKRDILALQESAKTNPHIKVIDVNEDELLYLSWGKENHTQEEIEEMYKEALVTLEEKKEKQKGLYVLQDVENVPEYGTKKEERVLDKSDWDISLSFQKFIQTYWDELDMIEQEQIYLAMDEGLTEEQLKKLMKQPLSNMTTWRRAFRLENQKAG